MAKSVSITSRPSHLPEMRKLPADFVSCRVPDHWSEPLLKAGDLAAVDPKQRTPTEGGVFLINWGSGSEPTILETNISHAAGTRLWVVSAFNRPRTSDEIQHWIEIGKTLPCSDGFYEDARLEECIVGRVVGRLTGASAITEATMREALRAAEQDIHARQSAEHFDPVLYTELCDRTGMVGLIQETGDREALLFTCVNDDETVPFEGQKEIYNQYASLFLDYSRGGPHSAAKLRMYLREQHRIVLCGPSGWKFDPLIPPRLEARLLQAPLWS